MFAASRISAAVAAVIDLVPTRGRLYAHCDIPCGIYDPHEAQIAALTTVRMCQLIGELPKITADSKPEERVAAMAKLVRLNAVKGAPAEKPNAALRVLWGDYFTADPVKAHPNLHEMFF